MMFKRFVQLIALVFFLTFLALVAAHAEGKELRFYQTEPPCAQAQPAYLVMQAKLSDKAEYHRIYVCGYNR